MNNCTVVELLKDYSLPSVTILHGCGNSYHGAERRATAKRVRDLVKVIQEVNPATVITISPIDPKLPMCVIENRTQHLCAISTVALYVTTRSIKIGKWHKHMSRLGNTVTL
jgi:hypothetical protein